MCLPSTPNVEVPPLFGRDETDTSAFRRIVASEASEAAIGRKRACKLFVRQDLIRIGKLDSDGFLRIGLALASLIALFTGKVVNQALSRIVGSDRIAVVACICAISDVTPPRSTLLPCSC